VRKSTFLVPTVDPQQFYAAYFELLDDIPAEAVYVQLNIQYANTNNEQFASSFSFLSRYIFVYPHDFSEYYLRVTRITTFSIPTTGNKETFLSTLDLEVTTLLLARLEVILSRDFGGDVQKINNHVDATLRRVIKGCGDLRSPPSFHLPSVLQDLPFRFILTLFPFYDIFFV
jgi:hypothetical protein